MKKITVVSGTAFKSTLPMIILYGITGILIALYSITIYSYVRMQINDNTRINAAGRLRMLTQKITKDILLYQDGVQPKSIIENSVIIFHTTIYGITRGGAVPLDMTMTMSSRLPAIDDRKSRALLERVILEWEPFKSHVMRYLDRKDAVSLRYILDHNEHLMDAIDRTVMTIQKHADADQRALGLIIASAIALVIIAVSAALVQQLRRYRLAETRLAEIEQLLPICSSCKKIRTGNDHPENPRSWTSIDEYLRDKKDMIFTHSICPTCMMKLYPGTLRDDPKKE